MRGRGARLLLVVSMWVGDFLFLVDVMGLEGGGKEGRGAIFSLLAGSLCFMLESTPNSGEIGGAGVYLPHDPSYSGIYKGRPLITPLRHLYIFASIVGLCCKEALSGGFQDTNCYVFG